MDLTDTIVPRSDQLNSDDLFASPHTVTITDVRAGSTEQPVDIHLAEYPGRPFKPSKTVRRILVAAWGKDGDAYVGRRLTLYRDPDVRFGGQDVGGIRVSHMSHIDKPLKLALTVSKGKKAPYVVKPLADDAPTSPAVSAELLADLTAMFERKGVAEGVRLAGVNKVTGGSATALEVITDAEARQVMAALEGRPDVQPAPSQQEVPVEKPPADEPPADFQGEPFEAGR